ncbi:MAG: glycosyltransferase [Burkholderia gladioli]
MEHHPIAQRISVVVLTWNRADTLATTLDRLLALPENPPIFLADNGSDDHTVALVKARFPTVCVIECGENLGAAGRNLAAECVSTDYVAFCDDDTWWEAGALERAVQVLDAWPQVGVLSARVLVGDEQQPDPTCDAMRMSPLGNEGLPGPALVGYMAGACVFRTGLFRRVGGYEPRLFLGGEEELVALDVLKDGKAIVYCEQLHVHHHPSDAQDGDLRRRTRARNAAWIAWLRLPFTDACRATFAALGTFARDGRLMADGAALLQGLGWVLPRRDVVPDRVLNLRLRMRCAQQHRKAPAAATATSMAVARAAVTAEAEQARGR